jgi:hypothetical protein
MLKVGIRNFQSLSKVDLEVTPGVTAIVGENSVGKTAIFRALSAALFNLPVEDQIKRGTSGCAVAVEYDDHKVLWRRVKTPQAGGSKTTYWVDGKQATKVGKGQYEGVKQALGFGELAILGSKVRLNFWNQEAAPFLMNLTPAKIFEFLSASSSDGNLTDVVRDMRSDLNVIVERTRTTEGAIDALTLNLSSERDFLEEKKGFYEVHKAILALDPVVMSLNLLDSLYNSTLKAAWDVASYGRQVESISGCLKEVEPRFSLLSSAYYCFSELSAACEKVGASEKAAERAEEILQGVEERLGRFDLSPVEISLQEWEKTSEEFRNYSFLFNPVQVAYVQAERVQAELDIVLKKLDDLGKELSKYEVCPLCEQPLKGESHVHAC